MSYYALDELTFNDIKDQLEDLGEYLTRMSAWDHNFIVDNRNRLRKYGREIAMTEKQIAKLDEIYTKYCGDGEEKVRDTVNGFEELRDRDKNRRF